MTAETKQLRHRWNAVGGDTVLDVLNSIRSGQRLHSVAPFGSFDGMTDLRGISLAEAQPAGQARQSGGVTVSQRATTVEIKGGRLKGADLSHCYLPEVMWHRCEFRDIRFEDADLSGCRFWACQFESVSFDKTKLENVGFGGHIGYVANSFTDVLFRGRRLSGLSIGFASFARCRFDYDVFSELTFDGSPIVECEFMGRLDSVAFRRSPRAVLQPLLPWQRIDPKRIVNPMRHVDFTRAQLRGVDFDSVDLSTCQFPKDENHLVMRNHHAIFKSVLSEIRADWPASDQSAVDRTLDGMFVTPGLIPGWTLTESKIRQPVQVINRLDLNDYFGSRLGNKVFEMLQRKATTTGALL